MATHIFELPCLLFDMEAATNEDWRDAWPYVDSLGRPLPVVGTALGFTLTDLVTGAILVVASAGAPVGGLPINGRIVAGGTAGNVVGLNVPRATMMRVPPGPGRYAHETQASVAGLTKTIARGTVTILQGRNP